MRRRRSKKTTIAYIGIFILSIVLAALAVRFLPIPGDWKRLALFVMIPLLSFAGVFITEKAARR